MSRERLFDIICLMEITYLGHSSFKLKGKNIALVTDPYGPHIGFKFPKSKADIVTVSHDHEDHNQAKLVDGNPFVISGPGEYEVKGTSVFGVSTFHDQKGGSERGQNTAYMIEMDGLRICHLGDLGHKLTDRQLDQLDGVDILLIPVGGFYTIGPAEAAEVVSRLEPLIVIPMHFNTPKLNQDVFGKLSGVEAFLKEMGEEVTPEPKLQISRDKLPEELKIVVLKRRE